MRKIKFNNSEFYHVYNRGVDKRMITMCQDDSNRFVQGLIEFNRIAPIGSIYLKSFHNKKTPENQLRFREPKLVHIVAYCLNPNHFHLILKQLGEGGIPNFLHKIGTGFTNFFNKKYKRPGSLLEGPYKGIHIDNNNYLLWLSGYVNGNSEIHKIAKADGYKWSSYGVFLGQRKSEIISGQEVILSQFNQLNKYKEYESFVKEVIKESKKRKDLEKYLLEE